MNSRFIILIPFYNVSNFIIDCYQSILAQKYPNWIALFGDDHSSDNTSSLIPITESRFIKHYNAANLGPLGNIINLINNIPNPQPDDILIVLDGDDKLLNENVLSYLNDFYKTYQPLLVYGQYINNYGSIGHARPISNIEEYHNLRQIRFFMSHTRTWKYEAYQLLLKSDPNLDSLRDETGNFFKYAGDAAMMYSLAEVVGFENIKFNPMPTYWYRIYNNNENRTEQENVVAKLKSIIPLNQK